MVNLKKYVGWIIGGTIAAIAGIVIWLKIPKAKVAAVTPEQQQMAEMTTEGQLVQMAMKQLNLSRDDIVIRSLIPQDFGLTSWNFAVNPGYNTIINTSVADNTFIALTSGTVTNTNIGNIEITAGASVREYWNMQAAGATTLAPTFVDSTPSIIQQNQPIIIRASAIAGATQPIIFGGIVAEKRGISIG